MPRVWKELIDEGSYFHYLKSNVTSIKVALVKTEVLGEKWPKIILIRTMTMTFMTEASIKTVQPHLRATVWLRLCSSVSDWLIRTTPLPDLSVFLRESTFLPKSRKRWFHAGTGNHKVDNEKYDCVAWNLGETCRKDCSTAQCDYWKVFYKLRCHVFPVISMFTLTV